MHSGTKEEPCKVWSVRHEPEIVNKYLSVCASKRKKKLS